MLSVNGFFDHGRGGSCHSSAEALDVQWLGRVPGHWEVDRCKWSVQSVINGIWGSEPDEENDLVCVRVADFDRIAFRVVDEAPTIRAVEASQRGNRILRKGDLLIEKSGGGEKQLVGCVVQFDLDLVSVCSNFVARMPIAAGMNSRFWTYVHAGMYAGRINYPSIKQTTGIQNLDSASYLDERVAYPPLPEQTAIADFLDRETGRVDTLVAKKRRLIALLREKRSALISRTVTRGLPDAAAREFSLEPHTRFRDSGIEWLGEVPEAWEVKKLGHLSAIVRGASPRPAGDPRYFDGDYIPWITVGEVTKDTSVFLESTETMLTEEGAGYSRTIKSGTLVITNSGATLGVPKILKITGCANDGIVAFEHLSEKSDIFFLYFFLTSLTTDLRNRLKQGGGQPNLNTDLIKAISVPFPSKAEQTAIATYLDRETTKIDRLVEKVEAAIDRLQEYRTALITAAVTGKIDVREIAA